jgi:hypothetical protein
MPGAGNPVQGLGGAAHWLQVTGATKGATQPVSLAVCHPGGFPGSGTTCPVVFVTGDSVSTVQTPSLWMHWVVPSEQTIVMT